MINFPSDDILLKILKPGQKETEDSFVERKRGFSKRKILKTIVAFANTVPKDKFAIIFVGVSDNGNIFNVQGIERKMQYVRILCNDICYPPVKNFKIRKLSINEDVSVLAIILSENKEKPYFSGRSCIRQGSSNVDATEDHYNKFIAFRNSILYEISKLKPNAEVQVVSKGRNLGANTTRGSSYRRANLCFVESFNPRFVTFKTVNTQERHSEPVNKITLSYDNAHYRLKFIIDE